MNVGAILDNVAGELDAQVLAYMQEYAIPPSLMDKVYYDGNVYVK